MFLPLLDHASPVTPVSPGAEKPRDDGFVKLNLATDPTTHMVSYIKSAVACGV